MEQPKAKGVTAYRCCTTAENHKDKEPPTIEAIRRHPPSMVATRLSDDDSRSKIPRSASDDTTSTRCCFSLLFPRKLQRILSDAERNAGEGWDKIIAWLPNGKGFKIYNKKRFADEIMPKYFGSSKFRTFQRSLNLWGFRTPVSGPNQGVSSHPLFQLGAPDLCKNMKRIVRKGKKQNENRKEEGGKSSDITIPQSKCRQQGTSVGLASPMTPPALQPAFSPSIASNPYICGGSEGNDFASFDFSANQHHQEQITPDVFVQQALAEVEEALAAATTSQEAIQEQLRLSTSVPRSRSSNGTTPFTSPLPIAILRESMMQPRSGNGSNEQRLYSIFAGATASSRPSSSTTSSHVLDVAGSSGGPTSVQKRPPSFPLVARFPPSSSSLNDNKAVTTTTSEGRNMTPLMVLPHHASTNDATRVQQEQAWQDLFIDQAARMVLASWGHQFN